MEKKSKIYVAGHTGLVGSAILRKLNKRGYVNIVVNNNIDLRNQANVKKYFDENRFEYVFLAAAKVGGILANNNYKGEFIYDNLLISANVIHASYEFNVKKLLNLGSSCIYPKLAPQPLKEEYLLSGFLEPTNEAYAIAKIAAIKLCKYYNEQYGTNFISIMPTNQYGINDNFDLENSHVLPAMIRKFHDAKISNNKTINLWGSGEVFREFMFSDDLSDACVFLMEKYDFKEIGECINVGCGTDLKLKDLAQIIKTTVGFTGEIIWDKTKPDGTPKKLLDVSKLKNLGWTSKVSLEDGIKKVYKWYKSMPSSLNH